MYYIKVISSDGFEYLPHIADTALWEAYDANNGRVLGWQAAILYQAVMERENHYQYHTPPAFGDPEYSRKSGIVTGILMATGISEELNGSQYVFKKGRRIILIVDRPKRPDSYYQHLKENNDLKEELGL